MLEYKVRDVRGFHTIYVPIVRVLKSILPSNKIYAVIPYSCDYIKKKLKVDERGRSYPYSAYTVKIDLDQIQDFKVFKKFGYK